MMYDLQEMKYSVDFLGLIFRQCGSYIFLGISQKTSMSKRYDWLHPSSGISISTPFNVEVAQSFYIQDLI